MEKVNYVDVDQITINSALLKRVKFKPVPFFWAMLVLALVLAIIGYIVPLKWVFVAGCGLLFYSSFSLFSIPDRWVVSIYEDAIVFFSAEPKQRGFKIEAKKIAEYNIDLKEKFYLYIRTIDGEEYLAKSFRYDKKVREALKNTLKGKETNEIKERREK